MINRTPVLAHLPVNTATPVTPKQPSASAAFVDFLTAASGRWGALDGKLEALERALPSGLRDLVSLQRGMQQTGVEVQLATAVADSLNQSLRKLQQSAGS